MPRRGLARGDEVGGEVALDVKGVRRHCVPPAAWVFLFSFGLLLFTWPVLTFLSEAGTGTACLYIHGAWLVIIALVVVVSRLEPPDSPAGEMDDV